MTEDTEITNSSAAAKKIAHKRPILWICAAILLIFLALSGIMFVCALRPLTWELGTGVPNEDAFCRFSFLPLRCKSDLEWESWNIGEHDIQFSLFGVPLTTTLTVEDTTPPEFTLQEYAILCGDTVEAEDFVQEAGDASAFRYAIENPADYGAGTHTVRIVFTDVHGNTSYGETTLTVYGSSNTVIVEAGCTQSDVRRAVRALIPEAKIEGDLSALALDTPLEQTVTVSVDGHTFALCVFVEDTVPPTAETAALYTLCGVLPDPMEFFTSVTDATAVTAEYEETPDTTVPGNTTAKVRLTDACGNYTVYPVSLSVYKIPAAVTMEAGVSQVDAITEILRGEMGCALATRTNFSTLQAGTHTVSVRTPSGLFDVSVTLTDTTPPTAVGRTVEIWLPTRTIPTPEDFVDQIVDASPVTAAFAHEMDFATPGTRAVVITLTDAAGNSADVTAYLTVIDDHTAPTITGVHNITTYVGVRPSYKTGVTAQDSRGGQAAITVDSSAVVIGTPGKYFITYTATDAGGNTSTAMATVTVLEITEDVIRPYAENVLERISEDGMTKWEMARAIYDWMTANVSYVTYADKTYWMRAAYYGFTTGRGDCFVYYAMSRVLLDCAGIDNLEISRDDPAKPHYWNLVNCGDGWYHFDTCPHYKQYPLTSFMLTDAEVRDYSENCVEDYYSFDASLYPATPEP